jgi:hypothetical protein
MSEPFHRVDAPWTEDQVQALNAWQNNPFLGEWITTYQEGDGDWAIVAPTFADARDTLDPEQLAMVGQKRADLDALLRIADGSERNMAPDIRRTTACLQRLEMGGGPCTCSNGWRTPDGV